MELASGLMLETLTCVLLAQEGPFQLQFPHAAFTGQKARDREGRRQ